MKLWKPTKVQSTIYLKEEVTTVVKLGKFHQMVLILSWTVFVVKKSAGVTNFWNLWEDTFYMVTIIYYFYYDMYLVLYSSLAQITREKILTFIERTLFLMVPELNLNLFLKNCLGVRFTTFLRNSYFYHLVYFPVGWFIYFDSIKTCLST